MRVLLFGGTGRDYADVQIKGLRQNGVEVLECPAKARMPSDDIVGGTIVRKTHALLWAKFFLALIPDWVRLIWLHRKLSYDIMLVNTSGFHNLFLAYILAHIRKRPLIYSAWISISDALADRGKKSRFMFWLEKHLLRLPSLVIVETEADRKWFMDTFGTPEDKIKVAYVGADDEVFRPRDTPTGERLNVLFYATNLPLHGIPVVLRAREILKGHNEIKFKLIGPFDGSDARWVPYDKLPDEINRADVVLGIFGTGPRSARYIPNKVFQPIACGRPIISASTEAMRECFTHGENTYLIPAGNPQALANAILDMRDASLRERIAKGGYDVYKERFTPEKIGAELKQIFSTLQSRRTPQQGSSSL